MLPNPEKAIIDENKITDYLLTPRLIDDKSGIFLPYGFSKEKWQELQSALFLYVRENRDNVIKITETQHGVKYVIVGILKTPDGRNPEIQTVWIIEKGTNFPRLVTAYYP